jgi:hypothetical protein
MVLEMGVLDLTDDNDLIKIDKIVDIILNWNINKYYDRNKNSCQVFCSEILNTLEFPLNFKGQLSIYFFNLKETFFEKLNSNGTQGFFYILI